MAKKGTRRKSQQPEEPPEQPEILEQLTLSEVISEFGEPGAPGLRVCHPRSNPLRNPGAVMVFDCLPFRDMTMPFQDISDPVNACIFVGLGETTIQFLIHHWQNRTGFRCQPKFYRVSRPMMNEQRNWAVDCGAEL